jgi:hypothetical protein
MTLQGTRSRRALFAGSVGNFIEWYEFGVYGSCRLDTLIGRAFAAVAVEVDRELCSGRAELVASHGQTVHHWVEGAGPAAVCSSGSPPGSRRRRDCRWWRTSARVTSPPGGRARPW